MKDEKIKKLENEEINRLVNGVNVNNTTNQLCQSFKFWQSVYRKSDVLRLLREFGRKRRVSERCFVVKGKR